MGIKLLPESLSKKIAAGEVIERPLSVVKELMENSLDAGAKNITIDLIQGGKVLISVTDDGDGIAPGELHMAVTPHATSKIMEEEDLESIMTLGYRGEALHSIAAVSQFEIYSRRECDTEGAVLRFEDGRGTVHPTPLRKGTSVSVRNLFYNLPARRKFLRSASSEFRRISSLVRDYALAYPSVAFTLTHGDRKVFTSDGTGDVTALLQQIWGDEPGVRAAEYAADADRNVRLWWQDCGPHSRFRLISFVNGRRINDGTIRSALQSHNWAKRGNWLVMITMPASDIDVNVHPSKSEVLFRHSGEIFDLVRKGAEPFGRQFAELPPVMIAVSPETGRPIPAPKAENPGFSVKAAEAENSEISSKGETSDFVYHSDVPVTPAYVPERTAEPFTPVTPPNFRAYTPPPVRTERKGETLPFSSFREKNIFTEKTPGFVSSGNISSAVENAPASSAASFSTPGIEDGTIYMGQTPMGYLVFSTADSILIVDPHAAHERINYERILAACGKPEGSEKLIMSIPLPPTLREEVMTARERLEKIGFGIDDDGSLSELPLHAKALGLSPIDFLRSALAAVEEERGDVNPGTLLHVFATKACKASVKLTTHLTAPEAFALLHDLKNCDQPSSCPHGRPVLLKLTSSALDKHFGRLGL